jgi:ribulose-phosphate 3-epimerase
LNQLQPNQFLVAPSILSADFGHLADEIKKVQLAGADWIHVDVMDGHFVPNLTIGAPVVKALRPTTHLPLDVHLMIEKPERYIQDFARAGANFLTIHVEATIDPAAVLKQIRALNVQPGITLRPKTPVERIFPFLPLVDLILVMTVEPGFGGQNFMKDQVTKIAAIRAELDRIGHPALIQVDGGVNAQTAADCREADVLVAGSFVFNGDVETNILALKNAKRPS